MDWISTPFLLVLFSGLIFFVISCAFCFMLGRLMSKLDGQDASGGRRTGTGDRRGPRRTHAGDRGNKTAVRELPEDETQLIDAPVSKRTSNG